MTDRHAGYIVTLKKDVRCDDAEEGVLNAIRMLRGVAHVEPILTSGEIHVATARARTEILGKIWEVLK